MAVIGSRPPAPGSTIGAELGAAISILRDAGVGNPESLAVITWATLAGTAPGNVWLRRGEAVSGDLLPRFHDAIARQAAGAPVQYAVGRAAFRHLELSVDHRVLIPRSETEGLVDHVLEFSRGRAGTGGIVADIGTGSGAIALSLATEGTFATVIATDISSDALTVAEANSRPLAPTTPVEFRQGSLLQPLGHDIVDVIVSNPPYVSSDEWKHLPALVRDFEPRLALDGGADGLDAVRGLLRGAAAHLRLGGLLALEIDSTRGRAVLELGRSTGWVDGRVLPDAAGRDRYFLATRSA
jgi:release factor glutamine methyltransferase